MALAALGVALLGSTMLALHSSGSFAARFDDLLTVLLYLFTPWTAINLVLLALLPGFDGRSARRAAAGGATVLFR